MNDFLSIVRQSQVTAPGLEVMLLLLLVTICLLFRASKTGLLVSYLFVYRWGWLFIADTFGETSFLFGYAVFGALVLLLSVVSMLRPDGS
jgi:hypothetical protein